MSQQPESLSLFNVATSESSSSCFKFAHGPATLPAAGGSSSYVYPSHWHSVTRSPRRVGAGHGGNADRGLGLHLIIQLIYAIIMLPNQEDFHLNNVFPAGYNII